MKSDEVVKALRCNENLGSEPCKNCAYGKLDGLCLRVESDAADLIEQQAKEIDQLKANQPVRCGECRHYNYLKHQRCALCNFEILLPDDYCSCGEKAVEK